MGGPARGGHWLISVPLTNLSVACPVRMATRVLRPVSGQPALDPRVLPQEAEGWPLPRLCAAQARCAPAARGALRLPW